MFLGCCWTLTDYITTLIRKALVELLDKVIGDLVQHGWFERKPVLVLLQVACDTVCDPL